MTINEYTDCKQAALDLAMRVSPDAKTQGAFVQLVLKMELDRELTMPEIIRHLVGRIYDGLQWGNWPKTDAEKIEITKEWCLRMAQREADAEIGAGLFALDPVFDGDCASIGENEHD